MEGNFTEKLIRVKPWIIFSSVIIISQLTKTIFGPILLLSFFGLFTLWTLGVGKKLHDKLEDKSILNLKRFKYQVYFVIIYIGIVLIFTNGIGYSITKNNIDEFGWMIWIIFPFHFFMMYCIIHTIYFLSKCITNLRNKGEGYGWFMLGFWFFPIGIWIIQPKIIDLLNKEKASLVNQQTIN